MNKDKKKPLKEKGVRLTAYVPADMKKQVEFLAFHNDSTSSAIVTEALTKFLKTKIAKPL